VAEMVLRDDIFELERGGVVRVPAWRSCTHIRWMEFTLLSLGQQVGR
jgi:hypothetical protein